MARPGEKSIGLNRSGDDDVVAIVAVAVVAVAVVADEDSRTRCRRGGRVDERAARARTETATKDGTDFRRLQPNLP